MENGEGLRVIQPTRQHFDTPLFQPLTQSWKDFERFEKTDDLSAWAVSLAKRLPEEWLTGIKLQETMLPYPVAEVGMNARKGWDYAEEIQKITIDELNDDKKNKSIFLIDLLVQHNFYTNAKQTMLLNIGRVLSCLLPVLLGRSRKKIFMQSWGERLLFGCGIGTNQNNIDGIKS
uniref:hypothetical protein n=1 Tax=Vibrio cholerae TaxID=666 RepID=UPI003F58EEC4